MQGDDVEEGQVIPLGKVGEAGLMKGDVTESSLFGEALGARNLRRIEIHGMEGDMGIGSGEHIGRETLTATQLTVMAHLTSVTARHELSDHQMSGRNSR